MGMEDSTFNSHPVHDLSDRKCKLDAVFSFRKKNFNFKSK